MNTELRSQAGFRLLYCSDFFHAPGCQQNFTTMQKIKQLIFSRLRRSYDITLVAQVNDVAMSDVTCMLNVKQEGVNDIV